jgi:hypothetical protein
MRFEFRIGDNRRFDVTGTPLTGPEDYAYRRGGPYRLEGNRLVSPAINEGRPVRVQLANGLLHLRIDDGLEFRLRRQ